MNIPGLAKLSNSLIQEAPESRFVVQMQNLNIDQLAKDIEKLDVISRADKIIADVFERVSPDSLPEVIRIKNMPEKVQQFFESEIDKLLKQWEVAFVDPKKYCKEYKDIKFEVFRALADTVKCGFKLPRKVVFKVHPERAGFVRWGGLNGKIFLNPEEIDLTGVTFHEVGHLNDIPHHLKKKINEMFGLLDKYGNKKAKKMFKYREKVRDGLIAKYRELIKAEISEYATKEPDEFVAETFEKLMKNGWDWNCIPKKLKGVYYAFGGPIPKVQKNLI